MIEGLGLFNSASKQAFTAASSPLRTCWRCVFVTFWSRSCLPNPSVCWTSFDSVRLITRSEQTCHSSPRGFGLGHTEHCHSSSACRSDPKQWEYVYFVKLFSWHNPRRSELDVRRLHTLQAPTKAFFTLDSDPSWLKSSKTKPVVERRGAPCERCNLITFLVYGTWFSLGGQLSLIVASTGLFAARHPIRFEICCCWNWNDQHHKNSQCDPQTHCYVCLLFRGDWRGWSLHRRGCRLPRRRRCAQRRQVRIWQVSVWGNQRWSFVGRWRRRKGCRCWCFRRWW